MLREEQGIEKDDGLGGGHRQENLTNSVNGARTFFFS